MKQTHRTLGRCAFVLTTMVGSAHAARAFELSDLSLSDLSGLFIGASIARTQIGYDDSIYRSALQAQASPFGTLQLGHSLSHERSNAWWADIGYMPWRYVGFDAAFLHLGEHTYALSGTFTPSGGSAENVIAGSAVRSVGPALAAVLRVPLVPSLELNFRVGDYLGRTSVRNLLAVTGPTFSSDSKSTSSLLLGAEVAYVFAGHWAARLDYLRVNKAGDSTVGTYNVNLASVGASYTF